MATWAVLGLTQDPAPGDSAAVRATAQRFAHDADLLARTMSQLSTISESSSVLMMAGDYAAGFQAALHELPGEFSKSERAYRSCGQALARFSASLEHAQSVARTALSRGSEADSLYTGAVQQIRNLMPPDRSVVMSGSGLAAHTVDAATTGLDEPLRAQIRTAASRARYADADRNAARTMALHAAALRGDAETTCAAAIDDSLHEIANKSWWHKAWDATVGVVTWPFTSWDHFVSFCGGVALVLGVAALFLSGPIGWGLMAAATIAGGVIAADGAVKYAQGKIGLGTLALDLLGVLPGLGLGGRAAGILGRLGREMPVAGRVFTASTRAASRLRPMAGLSDYTGSGYLRMNQLLRAGGKLDPATARRVQAVSDDLATLPPVKGIVYRGTHLEPDQIARYKPGEVVDEPAFTSASADPNKAFGGNTRFFIDSQTGKDVAPFSKVPDESEILFDRGTPFKVIKNEFSSVTGKHHIFLREVPK